MKILWVSGARFVGGAERVTLQLAALLGTRGHDVQALVAPGRLLARAQAEPMVCHRGMVGGSLNLRAFFAIRGALRALRPDVALVTSSDDWVWACLAKPRGPGARLVLIRHMALSLPPAVRWLAARRADAVVAVSEATRRSLLVGGILPPERVEVISNPVRFTPRREQPSRDERRAARRALGLEMDGIWVAFFGGTHPSKGLGDVLKACDAARREVGPLRVVVCGRGNPTDTAAEAAKLALDVRSLGETEEVETVITAADVVMLATSSRLAEAAPLTILEAMACGTPVVTYRTGGIAELIGDDGRAGRLARPDDVADLARELARLLRDPSGAAFTARVALERVRALADPALAADRYEQLFERLVGRRKGRESFSK